MKYRLEVVQLPVSDVDRAKAFYTEKAGFDEDHDVRPSDEMRVVQLTPPGSAASITTLVRRVEPSTTAMSMSPVWMPWCASMTAFSPDPQTLLMVSAAT